MELDFSALNWVAILVAVIAGQVVSTVWFVVLFGDPWARAYGAKDKKQHTSEVPGYTYAVGLLCTAALVLTIALLQAALSVSDVGAALKLGVVLALGLCIATLVPGQAFLRRWSVAALAGGSQVAMILVISVILVVL